MTFIEFGMLRDGKWTGLARTTCYLAEDKNPLGPIAIMVDPSQEKCNEPVCLATNKVIKVIQEDEDRRVIKYDISLGDDFVPPVSFERMLAISLCT